MAVGAFSLRYVLAQHSKVASPPFWLEDSRMSVYEYLATGCVGPHLVVYIYLTIAIAFFISLIAPKPILRNIHQFLLILPSPPLPLPWPCLTLPCLIPCHPSTTPLNCLPFTLHGSNVHDPYQRLLRIANVFPKRS